jgi:hypothetical protein
VVVVVAADPAVKQETRARLAARAMRLVPVAFLLPRCRATLELLGLLHEQAAAAVLQPLAQLRQRALLAPVVLVFLQQHRQQQLLSVVVVAAVLVHRAPARLALAALAGVERVLSVLRPLGRERLQLVVVVVAAVLLQPLAAPVGLA